MGIRPSLLSGSGFISEERNIPALHFTFIKIKIQENIYLFQLPLFRKILQVAPLTKSANAVQLLIFGPGRLTVVGVPPGQRLSLAGEEGDG